MWLIRWLFNKAKMKWQLVLIAAIFFMLCVFCAQGFSQKLPGWIFKKPPSNSTIEVFVASGSGINMKSAYLDAMDDVEFKIGQLTGRKINYVGVRREINNMQVQFSNAIQYKVLCQYPVLPQNFFGQVYLLVGAQKDINAEPVYPLFCNCGTEKTRRSRTLKYLHEEMLLKQHVIEKMNEEFAKNKRIKKTNSKTIDSLNLANNLLMGKLQSLENRVEIHNQSALLYRLTDSILYLDSKANRGVDLTKYINKTGQLHQRLIKYFLQNPQDEIVKYSLIHYYDGLEAIYLKYDRKDKLMKILELKSNLNKIIP